MKHSQAYLDGFAAALKEAADHCSDILEKQAAPVEPIPEGPDFAAVASQSALDGTAKRTRLSEDSLGMSLVDLDRGPRSEDARVVGLRTLFGAVRTDRERSRIRREWLRQMAALRTEKQAQTVDADVREQRKARHLAALKQALLMAAAGGGASAALSSPGARLKAAIGGAVGSGVLTYLANVI